MYCGTEYPRQEQLVGVNGYWTSQPEPFLYCVFRSWEGRRPLTALGVRSPANSAGHPQSGGGGKEAQGGSRVALGQVPHIKTVQDRISSSVYSAQDNKGSAVGGVYCIQGRCSTDSEEGRRWTTSTPNMMSGRTTVSISHLLKNWLYFYCMAFLLNFLGFTHVSVKKLFTNFQFLRLMTKF